MITQNLFADFAPKYEAITCSGRRIVILPFTGKTEALVVSSGKDKDAALSLGKRVCKAHVHVGTVDNHRPIEDFQHTVYGAEEQDMLFLARYYSYTFKDLQFKHQCHKCGEIEELNRSAEISSFKRYLIECGDDSCACKRINKELEDHSEEDDGVYNSIDWMNDKWVDVPESHLTDSPPDLTYKAPELYGSLKILCQHLSVDDMENLTKKIIRNEAQALTYQLQQSVIAIDWTDKDISTTDKKDISIILNQMPLDLRQEIRSFLDELSGGIDSEIDVKCESSFCRAETSVTLGLDKDFFLPLRSKK